jgi:Fe-S cluster biogenesis protein NfuA
MFACIYLLFLGTIVVVTGYHKGHNYKLNHYSSILRRSTSQDNVELSLGKSLGINEFITNYNINNRIEGVYAISDDSNAVVYVGSSSTVYKEIKEYYDQHGIQTVNSIRIQTFAQPKPELLESYKKELISQTNPWGNRAGSAFMLKNIPNNLVETFNDDQIDNNSVTGNDNSVNNKVDIDSLRDKIKQKQTKSNNDNDNKSNDNNMIQSPFASTNMNTNTETYLDFTKENIDKVLDEIRPYLIQDGGNVAVVDIDKTTRSITLSLQGACGSCPSSTTTMKMGIERVLKENFYGLGEIKAVDNNNIVQTNNLTEEMVTSSLDKILPAVQGMGGSVEINSIDSNNGIITITYKGPSKLKKGIELVLKDIKFVTSVIIN